MSDDRHPSRVSGTCAKVYMMVQADIRRQLAPGSCYTADLKFMALSGGVQSVESVRVIDLATNEIADIRDLPSIVAVEKGTEGM